MVKVICFYGLLYDGCRRKGIDPSSLLNKYMSLDDGAKVESWEKKEAEPMKVIKTWVRTKSGRLVEKTIMLTAEEYERFQVKKTGQYDWWIV